MAGITAPAFQQSVPPAATATLRASRFLLGHAEAASKLPIAGEDNAAAARTADAFTRQGSPNGEQVSQFIEDRLSKWTAQTAARKGVGKAKAGAPAKAPAPKTPAGS